MKSVAPIRFLLTPALFLGLISCSPATAKPTATPAPTVTPTATAIATAAPVFRPGDFERTVEVGGAERSYLLHFPRGVDARTPVPAVFVFHGWSGIRRI